MIKRVCCIALYLLSVERPLETTVLGSKIEEFPFLVNELSVILTALQYKPHTPARTHSISGLKSRVLKLTFFSLKMMVKSGLEFILKFTEPLQANLLGQFSLSGQIFLHRAAATLKAIVEFQNNFF